MAGDSQRLLTTKNVKTPWGVAGDLPQGRLRSGPGANPGAVEESQRRRLFGATVACTATFGFANTTVGDLAAVSGVSRRALYSHFEDKAALLGATIEAILAEVRIESQLADSSEDMETRLRSTFSTFARFAVEHPAAAATCLIEAHAGGPATRMPLDAVVESWVAGIAAILAEDPGRALLPTEVVVGLAGASLEIVRDSLQRGHTEGLLTTTDEVVDLLLTYRAPGEVLRMSRRIPTPSREALEGGDQRERVLGSLARLCLEHGYENVLVEEIVKGAVMSPKTFYAGFRGKEDVLLAAIDSAGAQMVAAALPAYGRHADWGPAVRAGIGAMLNFLATRPGLANLMLVEVHAAGPTALERRNRALGGLAAMLAPAWEVADGVPGVAPWALAQAGCVLGRRAVIAGGAETLVTMAPILTYTALAPYLGAKEATAAANGSRPAFRPVPERFAAVRKLAIQPLRRQIMVFSEHMELVTEEEIVRHVEAPDSLVREHLEALVDDGLLEPVSGAMQGPGQSYRATLGMFEESEWEALPIEERERVSTEIGDVIASEIEIAIASRSFDARVDRHLSRVMTRVDEEGWIALGEIHDRALTEALQVQEECAARLGRDGRVGRSVRSLQTLFEMPDF